MKKWLKIALSIIVITIIVGLFGVLFISYKFANKLVYNPVEQRQTIFERKPAYHPDTLLNKHGLTEYEEITLLTSDSLQLEAMVFPSQNGAAVIVQNGYKMPRFSDMHLAAMLIRHGYGAILPVLRAHGNSDGELLTFGYHERKDLDAIYQYLLERPDVNPEKIGIIGRSMGGALSILYTAGNPGIKAVVAVSPYDSFDNTLATSIKKFTGLPPFPFAHFIRFFMERELGFNLNECSPVNYIAQISPRPIFLMTGGKDKTVNPTGGQNLASAAGEPCEFWFEPEFKHADFTRKHMDEFEKRVIVFLDKHLEISHNK